MLLFWTRAVFLANAGVVDTQHSAPPLMGYCSRNNICSAYHARSMIYLFIYSLKRSPPTFRFVGNLLFLVEIWKFNFQLAFSPANQYDDTDWLLAAMFFIIPVMVWFFFLLYLLDLVGRLFVDGFVARLTGFSAGWLRPSFLVTWSLFVGLCGFA